MLLISKRNEIYMHTSEHKNITVYLCRNTDLTQLCFERVDIHSHRYSYEYQCAQKLLLKVEI